MWNSTIATSTKKNRNISRLNYATTSALWRVEKYNLKNWSDVGVIHKYYLTKLVHEHEKIRKQIAESAPQSKKRTFS